MQNNQYQFIKEYIESRGGVDELSEDEKKALAEMVAEAVAIKRADGKVSARHVSMAGGDIWSLEKPGPWGDVGQLRQEHVSKKTAEKIAKLISSSPA